MQVGTEVSDGGTVRSCKVRGYVVEYAEWPVGQNPIGEPSETAAGGANIKSAQGTSNQAPSTAPQSRAPQSASTRGPAPPQSSAVTQQPAVKSTSGKQASTNSGKPAAPSQSSASTSARTSTPAASSSRGTLSSVRSRVVAAPLSSGVGSARIDPIVVSPATPGPGQRIFTPGIVTVGFPLTILPNDSPSVDRVPLQSRPPRLILNRSYFKLLFENLVTNCDVEGQQYKPGETVRTTKFVLQCTETGLNVLACLATDGSEIKVGETKMLNERKKASCTRDGQQYKYKEELVGDLSGTIVFGPPGAANSGSNSGSNTGTTRTIVLGPSDVAAIGAGGAVNPPAATQAPPSDGSCAFEGKNHSNGEEWVLPARYRYKCTNGKIEILGNEVFNFKIQLVFMRI